MRGVQLLTEQAIRAIDSGVALWYVCPDGDGAYDAVCAAIRDAGRQGDMVAGRKDMQDMGAVVYIRARHAHSLAYIVRAFAVSGLDEQWYEMPVGGRHSDRAHRVNAIRQAIRRGGWNGQIGYELTENGLLRLSRGKC